MKRSLTTIDYLVGGLLLAYIFSACWLAFMNGGRPL